VATRRCISPSPDCEREACEEADVDVLTDLAILTSITHDDKGMDSELCELRISRGPPVPIVGEASIGVTDDPSYPVPWKIFRPV
jgi:hypothetical protein